ncbi:hypothetical protein B0H14DRAFT_2595682 [Mycena olivaceomarginata]|nr:hypothetical protein B0H14DRAFT_2595682 [Mycena olivaceomarginata]
MAGSNVHGVRRGQGKCPSVPTEALETEKIARIGQHSDFGSITLLFQDDVGGLEVEDPHFGGSFRPAPPVPGALVVNAGHFMMRCTVQELRMVRMMVCSARRTIELGIQNPDHYTVCAGLNIYERSGPSNPQEHRCPRGCREEPLNAALKGISQEGDPSQDLGRTIMSGARADRRD